MPPDSRIHPVFHISTLKRFVGPTPIIPGPLPKDLLQDLTPSPQAILDTRQKGGKHELLIHWKNSSPAEASWESVEDIKDRYPLFVVEDNHQFSAPGSDTSLTMERPNRPTQKKTPLVYHRREKKPKKPSRGWLMYQRRKKPKKEEKPTEDKEVPGKEGNTNKEGGN